MRKYQINIDPEQVNEKPGKNDPVFAVISNRVARHRENLSMSKIIHEIGENGRAFTRALVKDGIRDKDHFEKQIFLVLDFDENPNYKKIKKRLKKYGIPFTFTYKSLRNSDENPKFRAVFVLDDWIREPALADVLNNLLLEMFNDEKVDGKELLADQNCKELARMFLGGKGIIEKHSCARVTVKDVVDGFHRYYKDKKRENYTKRLKTLAKSLGVEVINNRLGIFEEKYVDDSLKDRKMIRDGNNVMFPVEKQKKKKEGEEQAHIKKLPSVLPNITKDTLKEACPLFKEYSKEERKLDHMERYVLATNLRYIKGGKSWFFEHLQKNKKKWEYDWETYIKVHPPVKCSKGCPYADICGCTTIYSNLSSKIRKLSSLDAYLPLKGSQEQLKICLQEAVDAKDENIYVIKAQTALGKTEAYCNLIQERPDKQYNGIVI